MFGIHSKTRLIGFTVLLRKIVLCNIQQTFRTWFSEQWRFSETLNVFRDRNKRNRLNHLIQRITRLQSYTIDDIDSALVLTALIVSCFYLVTFSVYLLLLYMVSLGTSKCCIGFLIQIIIPHIMCCANDDYFNSGIDCLQRI